MFVMPPQLSRDTSVKGRDDGKKTAMNQGTGFLGYQDLGDMFWATCVKKRLIDEMKVAIEVICHEYILKVSSCRGSNRRS